MPPAGRGWRSSLWRRVNPCTLQTAQRLLFPWPRKPEQITTSRIKQPHVAITMTPAAVLFENRAKLPHGILGDCSLTLHWKWILLPSFHISVCRDCPGYTGFTKRTCTTTDRSEILWDVQWNFKGSVWRSMLYLDGLESCDIVVCVLLQNVTSGETKRAEAVKNGRFKPWEQFHKIMKEQKRQETKRWETVGSWKSRTTHGSKTGVDVKRIPVSTQSVQCCLKQTHLSNSTLSHLQMLSLFYEDEWVYLLII